MSLFDNIKNKTVQRQIPFKNNTLLLFTLFAAIFLFSSCDRTKFLTEDERFTGKNRILIRSKEKIQKKTTLKNELSLLYKQKRNRNPFNVWIYYVIQDPQDTLWYHNFARRFLAEPPSIFNEGIAKATAREMQDFLRNKRGFYNANVSYKLFENDESEIGVDYIVECGRRYFINSVDYSCQDSSIQLIIDNSRESAFLRKGEPVSSLDYDLEKNRLASLLQNRGYSQFYSNYIELTGDSSNFKVDLVINILNPTDSTRHKIFRTGKVQVFTDYNPNDLDSKLSSDTIDGIVFHRQLQEYFVKPELINSMIGIRTGDLTRNKTRQETYNRLSLLNPYKFIAIKQRINAIDRNLIDYDILLIPKQEIWNWNPGFEFNYVSQSQKTQLLGIGANFSLENDNLFRGAERFEVNFSADTDIRFITFRPQEFYLNNSYNLLFPKPIKIHRYSFFRPMLNLFGNQQYQRFLNYGSTKLSVSASYESLESTITILSGSASLGYQYNPSEKEIIHLNQISIDYFSPTILNDTLFPGEFFKNSLSPRVTTGFLFKDIAYSYTSPSLFSDFTWQILTGMELSGHEIFLINSLFNLATGNEEFWELDRSRGIKLAKYAKSYLELRGHYALNTNNKLASRFYFGLGIPYGDINVLPYTKQFYVGGPQSLRAWKKRGLGPGAYYTPEESLTEIAYQKGDIRLEANFEYRFELPWYFEGAVFMDAGNIWTFRDDPNIQNENFTSEFYNQIAVAGGIGLRLNFNFLLVRVDLGYKLRTPYLDPQTNAYWQLKYLDLVDDGYLTLGLGYPF
jgi:hypothetical protein